MRHLVPILFLLCAGPLKAASPIAEVLCAPTPDMQDRLSGRLGSVVTATGLRTPDEVMEVWTDRNGAWTLVIRYASGTSCIVAMGEHWQASGI